VLEDRVAMRGIGRRQCCWGLVAFGALTTVGCGFGSRGRVDATTGPRERERALCREAAGEVERSTGFVKDPRVAGYVRDVGARLIGASVAPGGDWTFGVVDDDEPNAFSLPGGHIYVSRGLLVFLNAEDELAGVLGHEVGHVVAHHAVRRATAATPVAVLFGVPAALLGVVSPDLGGLVAGTGKLAGGVVLSAYSREQEREADRLGMESVGDIKAHTRKFPTHPATLSVRASGWPPEIQRGQRACQGDFWRRQGAG
jgi:predicted Zn-dependent protease